MTYEPLRIYVVWAREYSKSSDTGREKIVDELRRYLLKYQVESHIFQNILQSKGWIRGILHLCVKLFPKLLLQRKSALQVLMYDDPEQRKIILQKIKKYAPHLIIIDSVRLVDLIDLIRVNMPDMPIIGDFDDLLSRRYMNMACLGAPINFGFLRGKLPDWISNCSLPTYATNAIYSLEAKGLVAAEKRASKLVSRAVFVSSVEAQLFNESYSTTLSASIIPSTGDKAFVGNIDIPMRFVFVGSNRLQQNAMTISYLVDLWKRRSIRHPLHIYGRQDESKILHCENVYVEGYVSNIDEIYSRNAVLVTPSFLPGGLKTKVLEAFSFGVPVIGNSTTFEGIESDYPLNFKSIDKLEDLIESIDDNLSLLCTAGRFGYDFVHRNCLSRHFSLNWDRLIHDLNARNSEFLNG